MSATRVATPLTLRTQFPTREYGLDFLRVFAFAVLIFYHAGMIFVPWNFHIKNAETSEWLAYIMLFFNRWRLPLLFFISGAVVSFSLRRRSLLGFARERMLRLFVPLVFGMLVVVPPQIYFERLHRNQYSGSFLEWWPSVLQFVPYPEGGSLSWHHLWFVLYILVYSLVALPVFAFLRSGPGTAVSAGLANLLERRRWAVYAITIPNLIVALTLGPRWPVTHNLVSDWANLAGSFLTFLWGFLIASEQRSLNVITRRRREFLLVGIALFAVFLAVRALGLTNGWPAEARLLYSAILSNYLGLAWVFALTGYARAFVVRPSPALAYANEVVYPFYIVHQTVTIAAGFYIIQTSLSLPVKLALVTAVTFAGSLLLVELIRRTSVLRPLFGLRFRSRL